MQYQQRTADGGVLIWWMWIAIRKLMRKRWKRPSMPAATDRRAFTERITPATYADLQ